MGEECQGALCFVLVYAACCKHGWCFSKRRNSNDEGYNGGGAHPRVCTLLDLSVSLPAVTAFGSGLFTLRHCLPTCHQRRQQLTNRGGG